MGRCNNRRAQERAAQDRNTPSRARFSKGPPKNNSGRGGGRSVAAHESVVQKLQDRAQQQRADIGGISIVKRQQTAPTNPTVRRKKHPLDGVHVAKLDVITLSIESVAIVEKLLRAYNVWDGDEDDQQCDVSEMVPNEFENRVPSGREASAQDDGDFEQQMDQDRTNHHFALLHGDDSFDDYQGDYEDEPDYQCSRHDEMINKTFNHDSDDDLDDSIHETEDQTFVESHLFRHLTQHYSFQPLHVIQALKASHKRLTLSRNSTSEPKDIVANENEGILLEMSMDWLSLHLKESDLRRGFAVQAATKSFLQTKRLQDHPGWNHTIKAVPHDSISIMPKLTESQYKKETTEAMCQWKQQELSTELVRMGFHMNEVERAMGVFETQLYAVYSFAPNEDQEDHKALHPASILDGMLFVNLIDSVESDGETASQLDSDTDKEIEKEAILERDQEKEVLEAIYAEAFQVLHEPCHYQLKLTTTDLAPPACNDSCQLHIFTRNGYPLTSAPSVWFVNPTLPPSLLRRISIHLQTKAKYLVGQAAVYDIIEFLTENISMWQKEYTDQQTMFEEKATETNVDSEDDDQDEIDFYTTTFTAEEKKKLSRRQRQKLRAAEKSHARDEVLLEKQRQKELKDEERRERIRIEDATITTRRAEQVVERRWKEWVEEEAEKAARKAMNDAFLRDETREKAREAADTARKKILRFHGELDTDEDDTNEELIPTNDAAKVDIEQLDESKNNEVPCKEEENAQVEVYQSSPKIYTETTAKTLAFTEKLRRMYDQKAKEKAANCCESETESRTIQLTNAATEVKPRASELTSAGCIHVPSPIATPSPCMENILHDIVAAQKEQPWLVQPDARVPTFGGSSVDTNRDMLTKKDRLSNEMRVELERLYKNTSRGVNNKNERRPNKYNLFDKMLATRRKLPAYKMRDEVLKTIRSNQITVISGDTGCGKTTQVPQLVLDDLIMLGCGADANIIVTQPRRISAIGVSERIATERCEKIGQTVGYSIRLESKRSSKTRLLLCTTGVLLRRLQVDPDLASVSHIFVDEVHERDLNTDFLLIILKDLLQRRPSLKLVLMSATLNAETFSNWFGGCPTVSIPGRAQPVQEYRLEDALHVTGHLILEESDCAKKKKTGHDETNLSKTSLRRMYPKERYGKNVIDSLAIVDESVVNYELIAELLQYICTTLEEGAILVFLPGFKEITTTMEAINKLDYFRDANALICPLHSTLSSAEQTAIFHKPPDGKRKIVLSTNIAETSITIDDVVFVVDAGRVKENRYDDLNKMPTLTECWVSKASAKQRRGRAGRVKPGYCWHLYSTHTHDRELADYQLPEMLRVGLEDLVLQILVLDLGEPSKFLKKAVNPPSDLAIKNALDLLESLGAAECNWDDSQNEITPNTQDSNADVSTSLTALGYHLATIPVHPRVGKMMIYGALFGVYDSCLTMAAAMTSRSPFISSFDNRDAADEAKKSFASDDHISILLAFNQWRYLRQRDGRKAKAFLRENFLSYTALQNIMQLRKQLEKYMLDIGFSASISPSGVISINSNEMHLIRAVIAAGLYPNIIIAPKSLTGKTAGEVAFRGQKNDVFLHPCTIAFSATELGSRYGCFHEIVKTSKVYVRDFTTVSKFAILLFGGTLKVYQSHGVAAVDDWLKFRIHAKPATLVKYLRSSMEALLLEKIMDPEIDVDATRKGKAVIDAVSALLKMESIQQ